jgi:hypothetical protein
VPAGRTQQMIQASIQKSLDKVTSGRRGGGGGSNNQQINVNNQNKIMEPGNPTTNSPLAPNWAGAGVLG